MHIITNTELDKKGLDEIESIFGARPTVETTTKKLRVKHNPYFNSIWGDFDWIRSLFDDKNYTVRCFVTTTAEFKRLGIKGHIGMYDMSDGDKVIDFYIGLPSRLDKRAKAGGFKTNLAWLFCHEWCHGKEQFRGGPDRTHTMQDQNRIKELVAEHLSVKKNESQLVILLQKLVELMIKLRITEEKSILSELNPKAREKAEALIKVMAGHGYFIDITSGFRGEKEQNDLYAQGRTKPGKIVTNAKWGQSAHNFRSAFDVAFMVNGKPSWDDSHPWDLLGKEGVKLGLEWGGNWKTFTDRPHFELA